MNTISLLETLVNTLFEAEVMLLTEALKTSYNEATRVLPSKQRITKTTVMNKVHSLADEIPYEAPKEAKTVDYLFVEADEDHIAEQHGNANDSKDNKSFISKLIYIYECKKESEGCSIRKELINSYYFSGLYPGKEGNDKLWKNVNEYIEKTYDTENLKKVFISGDGAPWIKSGVEHIDKAIFCADKFHLMKYINTAAAQMLDEKDIAKEELWHLLYSKKNAKAGFTESIINLVKYSREQRLLKATGTDCVLVKEVSLREIRTEHYNQSRSYIDRIQVEMPGLTSRKTASIRNQLKII